MATPDTIGVVGGGAWTRWFFVIPKLFFATGGGAWVDSGGDSPAPAAGEVTEGCWLSILAGSEVIDAGGGGGGRQCGAGGRESVLLGRPKLE